MTLLTRQIFAKLEQKILALAQRIILVTARRNTALGAVRDASELLRPLLDGGHSAVAGEILSTMKAAGYDVRETDPFDSAQRVFPIGGPTGAPIV
jgi:hypothetical protein